ncbi:hypothetical protein M0813_09532 [Anaeramoeba flamelloides]|uniref:Uncharacterized protein n=1 Tax=Anaeramoeba flamelloides TaxID=1746091 RepID=A0ABQ8X5Y4_9EUKA|nr:hypothetical protein M0813_09532 [Anaeramoeba flamelloides]
MLSKTLESIYKGAFLLKYPLPSQAFSSFKFKDKILNEANKKLKPQIAINKSQMKKFSNHTIVGQGLKTEDKFEKCSISIHKNWNNISSRMCKKYLKKGSKELMHDSPDQALNNFENALDLATDEKQKRKCLWQLIRLYRIYFSDLGHSPNSLKVAKMAYTFGKRNNDFSLEIISSVLMSEIYLALDQKKEAIKSLKLIPSSIFQNTKDLKDNSKETTLLIYLLDLKNVSKMIEEINCLNLLAMSWNEIGNTALAIEILTKTYLCVCLIENSAGGFNLLKETGSEEFLLQFDYRTRSYFQKAKDLIYFRNSSIQLLSNLIKIYQKIGFIGATFICLKELYFRMEFKTFLYYLKNIIIVYIHKAKYQKIIDLLFDFNIMDMVFNLHSIIQVDLLEELEQIKLIIRELAK